MNKLQAGVAVGDITPPLGVDMGGYWSRPSVARGINDKLCVRVVAWRDGNSQAALVVLDLVALHRETIAKLRQRLSATTNIPGSSVLICCTHTHSGPLTYPYRGMGSMDGDYMASMEERVLACIQAATVEMKVVEMSYAKVPFQLGLNRRRLRNSNEDGDVVPYLHVIRLHAGNETVASIFSHPCHPVVLGVDNCEVSADFPGVAVSCIERHTGSPAIFVNGACGDINPRVTNGTFEDVEEIGAQLGQGVRQGLLEAKPIRVSPLCMAMQKVQLPLLPPHGRFTSDILLGISWLNRAHKCIVRKKQGRRRDLVSSAKLEWIREVRRWRREGANARFHDLYVHGIRLGELVLLGFEGELFARYQREIEAESPFRVTIVCGLANGCVGYLPTTDEYHRGGYEIDLAYKVYGEVQMFAPESEQLIRIQARQVLGALDVETQ